MTADEMRIAQNAIHDKIKKLYKSGDFDNGFILDGVADFDGYLNSEPRVAWILKEAWDEENGGEWDMTKEIIAARDKTNTAGIPTFRRVAYATAGIHTSSNWDDIPWITEDDSVADSVKKVVWLNVSKIAGKTSTAQERLDQQASQWKEVIIEQLKIYQPEIIILGNTMRWMKDILEIGDENSYNLNEKSAWGYIRNGRLIIWAYHPAARLKDEEYVNDIVTLIKKYQAYKSGQ